ncbi:MAG TPA: MbcA/ParS/Xre antitoxin family protein [Burkholderiales bacterium]|nr:MbcA/ParS/Xre antitoxin family protein [Burkholderiales bacterium]
MKPAPAPAPDIDLRARDSRERLARMVVALLDHWKLAPNDQALLLGLSAQSRSSIARYRRGEPLADSADLLARAGHLLGIHKALRILFPHDRDLAYRWVTTPNRRFADATPLDVMKRHGYEGMLAVRRYLDFERGR